MLRLFSLPQTFGLTVAAVRRPVVLCCLLLFDRTRLFSLHFNVPTARVQTLVAGPADGEDPAADISFKSTLAARPKHPARTRATAVERSDQRGSSSFSRREREQHHNGVTQTCVEPLELIDRDWHHMHDMEVPLPQLLQVGRYRPVNPPDLI